MELTYVMAKQYILDRLDINEVIMKTKKWQLQDAKNKFSEVVRKASEEGPQTVTKHGKDSVVVLSAEDYRRLEKPKTSIVDFFQESPLSEVDITFERNKSLGRKFEL